MKIEHIALYVEDLEKSRDFFVKYFCAKSNKLYNNPTKKFSSYFLSFSNGTRIEIMHKPNLKECETSLNRLGYAHLAFSVGSEEKVRELTERLRGDGYSIESEARTTGDGYYESSVLYEGNLIEITI